MSDRLAELLTRLNSVVKKLRLYPPEHTVCAAAIDLAMESIRAVTFDEPALTIGFAGMTAVHKGVPLMDLGTRAKTLLAALTGAGIRWVRIEQGVSQEEVVRFLLWITRQDERSNTGAPEEVWRPGNLQVGLAEPTAGTSADLEIRVGEVLQTMVVSLRAGGSALPLAELWDFVCRVNPPSGQSDPLLGMLELAMAQREYILRRALLTSALSMELSRRLGLEPSLHPQLGFAGLLADVALFKVDGDSLSRRHGGSQQIPRWSDHPSDGARILASAGAPSLAVVVAAEHHWGLRYASPARHPASSLVGMADTLTGQLLGGFGASSRRLDLALIALVTEGSCYPAELSRAMLGMSGLFVKGARVRLSNRQKGEIVTPNPSDPLRPEVLMDDEAEGMKLVDLSAAGERLALAAVLEE